MASKLILTTVIIFIGHGVNPIRSYLKVLHKADNRLPYDSVSFMVLFVLVDHYYRRGFLFSVV